MKKENINLLENYQLSEKQRKGQGSRSLNIIAIFLVTILVLSAYSVSLLIQDRTLKEGNDEIQSYISDPSILSQIKDITVKQRQLTDLNEILAELKSLNASFEVMPRLDSVVFEKIVDLLPPDTKILSTDFDGQWIYIKTSSTILLRPSEYARNLRNSGVFEDVIYDGYTSDDTGKRVYIGTVKVAMKIGE